MVGVDERVEAFDIGNRFNCLRTPNSSLFGVSQYIIIMMTSSTFINLACYSTSPLHISSRIILIRDSDNINQLIEIII